ncbi:MAG TPA: tetratricopeptide repeat protein [Acidimicrobiia bacterium]|nr:tetratricopeptide repeat protein [Acidimicrobiia bacterium]
MSMMDLETRLAEAVRLREGGSTEQALENLLDLHRERPDDARVNLQCAWAHDKLGREREAVPFYQRAIELGLEGDRLRDALIGLGSTYRALGEYHESLRTLDHAVEVFPEHRGLVVFRAMALYNNDRFKEACETLLRVVSETTTDEDIAVYTDAIDVYAADLDRTWQ